MRKILAGPFAVFAALTAFAALAAGQAPQATPLPANVSEHSLKSSQMGGRDMPYRVILPAENAASSTSRYPVIYLLHGLTGHYNNWTDLTKIAEYAKSYKLVIVMPEGGDGWYTDSVSKTNEKWESYIVQELIPEVDKKFRTNTGRNQRA